jgi:hypothetical protein
VKWYLEDPQPWPALPVKYAEIVRYVSSDGHVREGVVIDTATEDPATGGDRVLVDFYADDDAWVIPVSDLRPTGNLDLGKAGLRLRPTLADHSVVVLKRDGGPEVLAETLGLWTLERSKILGYCVRPFGEKEVCFAHFNQLVLLE